MFWLVSIAAALLIAGYVAWPLLRRRGSPRNYGLTLVVLVPVAAVVLYQQVGTPRGIGVSGSPQVVNQPADHATSGAGDMDSMIAQLEQRLQDSPADMAGWTLLGRSYKSVGRYAQAVSALDRAAQLAPDDPLVMVELAEARMYASGRPEIDAETRGMLERALLLDPNQQKALWLLGMAAAQSGNDALAVELWERLLAQLEPGSGVATALGDQLAQARERLGMKAPPAWPGIEIEVTLEEPTFQPSPGSVLFVIARNPAMPGPPVGVRRIADPVFPLRITLTDGDSMVPQSPVSAAQTLELRARLSRTGNVVAGAGDLSSDSVQVSPVAAGSVNLALADRG